MKKLIIAGAVAVCALTAFSLNKHSEVKTPVKVDKASFTGNNYGITRNDIATAD